MQQLGQLKRVDSESSRGLSVVTAVIQDRFHRDAIPQVWDELRRKVADVPALVNTSFTSVRMEAGLLERCAPLVTPPTVASGMTVCIEYTIEVRV